MHGSRGGDDPWKKKVDHWERLQGGKDNTVPFRLLECAWGTYPSSGRFLTHTGGEYNMKKSVKVEKLHE